MGLLMDGSSGRCSMTSIRKLEPYEVALLLPGARAFFHEGHIDGQLNEAHFVKQLTAQIENGVGVCFTADFRGAIAAVFYLDLATAELCCMEYFWYVHAEERGSIGVRLLAALEAECERRGVRRLLMMHMVHEASERFDHLYRKRGYVHKEQLYVKRWAA